MATLMDGVVVNLTGMIMKVLSFENLIKCENLNEDEGSKLI